MAFDLTEFRSAQRKLWSAGNWPDFATTIQPVADELVERVEVGDRRLLLRDHLARELADGRHLLGGGRRISSCGCAFSDTHKSIPSMR
jgi:hypothetical protein